MKKKEATSGSVEPPPRIWIDDLDTTSSSKCSTDDQSEDSGVVLNAKCLAFDITSEPDLNAREAFRRASQMTINLDSEENYSGVTPPDGGYGWLVVFASFMCNFTVDGICYTFGIFLPHFMQQFSSGKAITALAGSLQSGCYMTAGLFVSGLVNRYGCRPVAIVGAIVAASSLAITTIVPNVFTLIITYGLITGIFFGFVYLPSIVSVGFYFTSKRALATGIAVCGSGMGAFGFAPFVNWLLLKYDWKTSLQVLAGLMLVCVSYGGLMKPLEATKHKSKQIHDQKAEVECQQPKYLKSTQDTSGSKRKAIRAEEGENRKVEKEVKSGSGQKKKKKESTSILDVSILRLPVMMLLSTANVFGMTGYYIPYVYITGFAMETVRMADGQLATSSQAALLLSAIGISNVAGRLVFGVIADHAAGTRVLGIKISALLINNCCLLITGIATLLVPFCPSYWFLLVDCIAFGFFISCYMSLTSIILVDLLGLERLSTTFGVIIFFRGISSILGPPLAGILYEMTNSYTGVFLAAGALIIASSITHFIVHRYEK